MPRWLSWLNTSVSKQSQASITIRHTIYQAYKCNDNNSMQDINKGERDRAIANTRDLFRGSSTLALYPRLRHTKDFHYNRSHWIIRCRNTYKLSDSLVRTHRKPTGSPRPHLKQRVRTRTRNTESPLGPETMRTHTSASSKNKDGTLVITTLDHLKSSHNNTPIR